MQYKINYYTYLISKVHVLYKGVYSFFHTNIKRFQTYSHDTVIEQNTSDKYTSHNDY